MPTARVPLSTASIVGLAIIAEGLLTLMDAMIKSLAPRYSAIEIAFLRYAFGMIGAIIYAFSTRPGWPTYEAAAYNGLRAVLIVFTATTFFFALGKLPLADAIAMSFISPVLTAVLGAMILSERLDWRILVALVGGFLGMLLIIGGKLGGAGLDDGVLLGAVAVFVSAVGYSLNVIMLRHRATRDPLAQIILFQNVGPALLLALPALWTWSHAHLRRSCAVCGDRHYRRDCPYHACACVRAHRSRPPRPGRLCHSRLGRGVWLPVFC